jgi:DNA-binding CsgD family transcriptional regulator
MDLDVLTASAIRSCGGLAGRPTDPAAVCGRKSGAVPSEAGSTPSELQFLLADSGARVITDANRRILWATSAATLLASGGSCINITDGELAGRTRHSDALLRSMFEDSHNAAPGTVVRLIASEPSRRPELFVQAQSHALPGEACTLLTIRDLARELREIPDLVRLYGLTRTEQQVVAMMVRGQSVTEIAEQLHKSVLTVRTHVKRAYGKLGVGSKEQLFATVMKLMVD